MSLADNMGARRRWAQAMQWTERLRSAGREPPLLHQEVFAPCKLARLLDWAADHGVPPEAVLAGTRLTSALVHDPHTRTSVKDYLAACENIVAAGADPDIPFEVGSRLHLTA